MRLGRLDNLSACQLCGRYFEYSRQYFRYFFALTGYNSAKTIAFFLYRTQQNLQETVFFGVFLLERGLAALLASNSHRFVASRLLKVCQDYSMT